MFFQILVVLLLYPPKTTRFIPFPLKGKFFLLVRRFPWRGVIYFYTIVNFNKAITVLSNLKNVLKTNLKKFKIGFFYNYIEYNYYPMGFSANSFKMF